MSGVTLVYDVRCVFITKQVWISSYHLERKGKIFALGSAEYKHKRSINRGMKRLADSVGIKEIIEVK